MENASREVRSVVATFFHDKLCAHGDVLKAYAESVEMYYEGLPKGKSFASVEDPKWRQLEITIRADHAGDVSAPSDMEKVRLSKVSYLNPVFIQCFNLFQRTPRPLPLWFVPPAFTPMAETQRSSSSSSAAATGTSTVPRVHLVLCLR